MSVSRLTAATLSAAALALTAPAALAGGPEVFVAEKCTKCHSVTMATIPSAGKPQQRDLSAVGAKYDQAKILAFLKKEVELPTAKDPAKTAAHKFEWKGSDEDLTALTTWLAEQKTEAPPAPEGEGDEGGAPPAGAILPEPEPDPAKDAAAAIAQTTAAAEKQAAYAGPAAAPAAPPAPLAPVAVKSESQGGCAGGAVTPAAWSLLGLLGLARRRRAR